MMRGEQWKNGACPRERISVRQLLGQGKGSHTWHHHPVTDGMGEPRRPARMTMLQRTASESWK